MIQTVGCHILCANQLEPISWGRVDITTLKLASGFKATPGRIPTQIVLHWDATTSTHMCHRVLMARGLSYHFGIDNDGTIYQFVDTENTAWHAKTANARSIGINLSNAYYLSHQKDYLTPRPVVRSRVHGVDLGEHLGFYPAQVQALKPLLAALSRRYGIPLECPGVEPGVYEPAQSGAFSGVVAHYHLDRGKIDPAGLDIKGILEDIR